MGGVFLGWRFESLELREGGAVPSPEHHRSCAKRLYG